MPARTAKTAANAIALNLRRRNPERLYEQLSTLRGAHQDRCVLYTFRYAVYFASEPQPDPQRLKWWNWKDATPPGRGRAKAHV